MSRGVEIFIYNNFEHKVHKETKDRCGNLLMLDIIIEGKRLSLVNMYDPTEMTLNCLNNGHNILLKQAIQIILL